MVKFGGTLYQMLKNAFKKHPLQNRTNVQIKGGGGQRPFETMFKKTSLFLHVGFPKSFRHLDPRGPTFSFPFSLPNPTLAAKTFFIVAK